MAGEPALCLEECFPHLLICRALSPATGLDVDEIVLESM